jgi:hypothetical protein
MTDVKILKKSGVYDVEKMRTILLMNAEFNMNNKRLGRDMTCHAEKHGALAREQYGSCRNHQCILVALNKQLTMDLLRQTCRARALCANNTKSCYDHIVHNIGTLCMRRPIKSMFANLQRVSHKIQTAYGVFTKTYGSDKDPAPGQLGGHQHPTDQHDANRWLWLLAFHRSHSLGNCLCMLRIRAYQSRST